MDIVGLINASTAIRQTQVQSAVTVKMIDSAMETQSTGIELLLQGMDQFMEGLQSAVAGNLGQYIDIST